MSLPRDPVTGLTAKQEHFAQLVAADISYSDAYRQAYNVTSSTSLSTLWSDASDLAKHPLVGPRIQQLREAAQKQAEKLLAKKRGWNLERLADEAETNLKLSRDYKQMGSANGALELIGRATGLLKERGSETLPLITRVVVVLDRGREQPRVVEAAYEAKALRNPGVSDEKAPLSTGLDEAFQSDNERNPSAL